MDIVGAFNSGQKSTWALWQVNNYTAPYTPNTKMHCVISHFILHSPPLSLASYWQALAMNLPIATGISEAQTESARKGCLSATDECVW